MRGAGRGARATRMVESERWCEEVDRQLETHLFDEWVLLDNDVDNDSCPWLTHPIQTLPIFPRC